MKKFYIAMAVLATAVLSSCEREKDFNGLTPVGENGIAFVLNGVSTRSVEVQPVAVKGDVIPLGETGGESFFLSEMGFLFKVLPSDHIYQEVSLLTTL